MNSSWIWVTEGCTETFQYSLGSITNASVLNNYMVCLDWVKMICPSSSQMVCVPRMHARAHTHTLSHTHTHATHTVLYTRVQHTPHTCNNKCTYTHIDASTAFYLINEHGPCTYTIRALCTLHTSNYAQNLLVISLVCRYSSEVMEWAGSIPAKMRGGDSDGLLFLV